MKGNAWTESELRLFKEVYGTLPAKQLVKRYFPNRTDIALHKKAKKVGLKSDRLKMTSIAKKRYCCDENFFSKITKESSYWAGFIAADGCVSLSQQKLRILLKDDDRSHLEKFKTMINFDGNVYTYDREKGSPYCVINIYGIPTVLSDLEENFSVIERKSLIIEPPNIYDEKMIRHFVRGYFDGDGSIYKVSQGNTWRACITGGKSILEWIQEKFGGGKIYIDKSHFQLVFAGFRDTLNFLNWIYHGCNEDVRLDRKYDRYLKVLDRAKRIDDLRTFQSSKYRGVHKKRNKYQARIEHKARTLYLGSFDDELDAAMAYDNKAKELGLHDRCNFESFTTIDFS
jgi:hypothetical protein